jgi:hypothetical protein
MSRTCQTFSRPTLHVGVAKLETPPKFVTIHCILNTPEADYLQIRKDVAVILAYATDLTVVSLILVVAEEWLG